MNIQTTKYQRKPFYVEAVQVTEQNLIEVAQWCSGMVQQTGPDPKRGGAVSSYVKVCVINPKSERQTRAYVGDWVLKAGAGFKVYNTRTFRADFIPAPVVVQNDHNYGAYLEPVINNS